MQKKRHLHMYISFFQQSRKERRLEEPFDKKKASRWSLEERSTERRSLYQCVFHLFNRHSLVDCRVARMAKSRQYIANTTLTSGLLIFVLILTVQTEHSSALSLTGYLPIVQVS